jgi:hypothetical protein
VKSQLVTKCYKGLWNWRAVVDNEMNNNNNNKLSLRSNTKGYGGKIHETNSQNRDTDALGGRELYHLQFSLQTASPETFGYTFVCVIIPG